MGKGTDREGRGENGKIGRQGSGKGEEPDHSKLGGYAPLVVDIYLVLTGSVQTHLLLASSNKSHNEMLSYAEL